jgi:hypothetical protein
LTPPLRPPHFAPADQLRFTPLNNLATALAWRRKLATLHGYEAMKTFNVPGSAPGTAFTSTNRRSPDMSLSTKSALNSTFTALLCLFVVALPHAALAYDATADFSTNSNPNGVWSYGWSSTLGSAFHLDATSTTAEYKLIGLAGWVSDQSAEGVPYVLKNTTASPIAINPNNIYQPGQLALEAGFSGQYAVVRWTAFSTGPFTITATFSALSHAGDSSDVHILRNGISIFNSAVNGFPGSQTYSGVQNLAKGDTIDFAVGFGSDGSVNEDTTILAASIIPDVASPMPTTNTTTTIMFNSETIRAVGSLWPLALIVLISVILILWRKEFRELLRKRPR